MNRRRAIAWLGAVLAALWFFGAMGAGRFVDCFQPADYVWLMAGRDMLEDPASAWSAPWVAYWRPVTKAFFAGAAWILGAEAPSYVSLALLLHVLNGLLIADIALKFRAGPFAAAIGSFCFLLGRHHMVVLDSVAGLSVLLPAFLGLAGLRLSIARGTGAHVAAIFVLAAALWARETYAALPLVVILLLPGEERGWAHLTPRFALSLAILSAGYVCIRLLWQGSVAEVAQIELERAVDGSPAGLLTNLWALLRVATIPPRHVNPDGFWVALLFLLMLLSFSTHLKISRHRILRLLFGALLVFLPSALLRPHGAHEAIAFAEPHHLYAPAGFVAIAVCLLITLRPTDQRANGEGYEETCMRAIGELLTLVLLLVVAFRNADTFFARAEMNRERARATADQLQTLVPWIEASEPGRPLLLVRQRRDGVPSFPGETSAAPIRRVDPGGSRPGPHRPRVLRGAAFARAGRPAAPAVGRGAAAGYPGARAVLLERAAEGLCRRRAVERALDGARRRVARRRVGGVHAAGPRALARLVAARGLRLRALRRARADRALRREQLAHHAASARSDPAFRAVAAAEAVNLRRLFVRLAPFAILLPALAFLLLQLVQNHGLGLPLDDAWIHGAYARSIAEGQPFRLNAGDEISPAPRRRSGRSCWRRCTSSARPSGSKRMLERCSRRCSSVSAARSPPRSRSIACCARSRAAIRCGASCWSSSRSRRAGSGARCRDWRSRSTPHS
ncbi:MAG: hypothetical protein IPN34_04510 [Planctomycetes bacterium]|nr:hypothetical protein [Planctomycetota bacterium]